MRALIDNLLAYSRVSTKVQSFQSVNLNMTIQEVVSDLEARIQETGAFIDVSALPHIEADPMQMHQLLQNLIDNAIKFQPKDQIPKVKISGITRQNVHCFSVQDNGIGINVKYTDRIFNMFQHLHDHSHYEGTGIGLALCKKVVERHGGNIWVESKEGEGTTFWFTIPNKDT
jgi:light-regulated signal transduction histidine kinase (bacteriophytochrome)